MRLVGAALCISFSALTLLGGLNNSTQTNNLYKLFTETSVGQPGPTYRNCGKGGHLNRECIHCVVYRPSML